jgi:hypothetical protein
VEELSYWVIGRGEEANEKDKRRRRVITYTLCIKKYAQLRNKEGRKRR